ncbi:PP2C family protein-serine/threonine phosphatase [Streptomyces sp. NPDC001315]|uniref:PP2C family protein-serine/threonine phosphatase n=1 Tax=Streptomyces sp. NPDC001315 TaxID=3364562 RepID=UPI00367C159A
MSRVARWFRSHREPAPEDDASRASTSARTDDPAVLLAALRSVAAGVGTALDEEVICAELTRAAAGQAGGSAAVMRVDGPTVSGYESIAGETHTLPDVRWAAAVARDMAAPAVDMWREQRVGHSAPGRVRPALCVPLATGEHRYGVLVCAREGTPFTHIETEVLALLAERAASHLRHAREHARVSRTAGDLQRALRAEPGRPHPNLDVAVRYLPAGQQALVGGDWCETVRLHFGRTLLVVGDVMGHGVEAAVDMAAYRSDLRALASADLPPHRVLRQLDALADELPERRPATCLIAQVDPVRGQVTVAGAGHLPPALIDREGGTSLLPVPVGPPLGTGFGGYEPATHELATDRTLLLFTDGLVERRGEDIDRSLDRLAGLRFAATAGVDDILDSVLDRLDAQHAEDDVAVLAARPRHPVPHSHPHPR